MISNTPPVLWLLTRNYKAESLVVIFTLSGLFTFAQFTIRLQADKLPGNHSSDSVYVAGNFNGWDPAKNGKQFLKRRDNGAIEIAGLPAGTYEFKFTRGNWQSVECLADGSDIANRQLNLTGDTVINFKVAAWKDDFAGAVKRHTVSPNVQIIDTAFIMPQLGRTRRIWLYLPPGYAKSKKRYPVMYMQDGQNIFDDFTAGFGEWGVDESVDSMIKIGKSPCIIVGIDNGPKRLTEYNPYEFKDFGKGEGEDYINFIVKDLKPFIDKRYRTLPTHENTIIAGSSMGGLIAYYAMLKYPHVFGKGGIFSPAFWTAEQIKGLTNSSGKNIKGTLFFYMGDKEGEQYLEDMQEVTEELGRNSIALIYVVTDPDGSHNEQAWRKWFPEFYNWVLANGFNNLIEVEED